MTDAGGSRSSVGSAPSTPAERWKNGTQGAYTVSFSVKTAKPLVVSGVHMGGADPLTFDLAFDGLDGGIAAIKIKGKRYPKEKAWKRIGTDRCRNATSSRTYRFSWPSKVDWKVGDRALVCYTQTKK